MPITASRPTSHCSVRLNRISEHSSAGTSRRKISRISHVSAPDAHPQYKAPAPACVDKIQKHQSEPRSLPLSLTLLPTCSPAALCCAVNLLLPRQPLPNCQFRSFFGEEVLHCAAMAASTAAIAAALSSSSALGCAPCASLKLESRSAAVNCRSAKAAVCVRASSSADEDRSVTTRRDVIANLLGAGAALGFAGQALAANPGSLARQKKVEKPEGKARDEKSSSSAASPRFE
ncbi:hypothetical protein MPTK1_6g04110 [Marchantia polymorpha subsp. ruderalis]|uniref:Uncharacterized protein n=2 Tax=Marchantia polymorpha TaxID=3197 RepID=A0AAF6BNC8_MARPO|nr:hypothetical protein MARPO_0034s0107 [Marchantia polymorpha]BBN13512.1 hypothetical protein Mp_6g04110 [Marchantia polymorpha subsp. ruderalis]|eukprot:PTQ41527.1 hypothetical protein MARPO_0034s0107 [Marchantia polymorpha]